MGIRGYISHVNSQFTGWKYVKNCNWDHLVVDGNNVCYRLYDLVSSGPELGGEYKRYSECVKGHFKELIAQFRNVMVIFDGSTPPKKMDTVIKRREDAMNGGGVRGYPVFIMFVFMEVLRTLRIEFLITEDEADNAVAGLANSRKCPVLGSDSDYLMFQLECGFIQLEHWLKYKGKARVFDIREFMKQFSLTEYNQCLLIPTFFGNDIITPSKKFRNIEELLQKASRFSTCREFLDQHEHNMFSNNFRKAWQFYCNLTLPNEGFRIKTPSPDCTLTIIPEWVFEGTGKGNFLLYLLEVHYSKFYLLPKVVEDIKKETAWLTSREIRQCLYGLMGVEPGTPVTELIRVSCKAKLTEERVAAKLLDPPINISDPKFEGEKLRGIVFEVLTGCKKFPKEELFERLEDKWKLPVLATYYWYRRYRCFNGAQDLLKSLLMSFLACSDCIPFPEVNPNPTGPDHVAAVHAFAQWQCVYFDARALNYLAREPFPTTSPAFLYSGEVAIHYATTVPHHGDWLARVLGRDSKQWMTVKQLLDLMAE